jgi:hypothetical protein
MGLGTGNIALEIVIASAAKQSRDLADEWIASPLGSRNDEDFWFGV